MAKFHDPDLYMYVFRVVNPILALKTWYLVIFHMKPQFFGTFGQIFSLKICLFNLKIVWISKIYQYLDVYIFHWKPSNSRFWPIFGSFEPFFYEKFPFYPILVPIFLIYISIAKSSTPLDEKIHNFAKNYYFSIL